MYFKIGKINISNILTCLLIDYAEKMFIPYQKVLGDSFVREKVETVNLENKEVKLSNGNKVIFRYSTLILFKWKLLECTVFILYIS